MGYLLAPPSSHSSGYIPHMTSMSPTAHPHHPTHTPTLSSHLPFSLPIYNGSTPPQRDHVHWLENLGSAAQKLPWRILLTVHCDAESTFRASSRSDAPWSSLPYPWSSLSLGTTGLPPSPFFTSSGSIAAPVGSTLTLQYAFMPIPRSAHCSVNVDLIGPHLSLRM